VLIEGEEGTKVELNVGGYQFPEKQAQGPGFDHDANWLRVQGHVFDGVQSWSFDDPCLMTTEVAELAAWLRGVESDPVAAGARIGRSDDVWFVEPNVSARLETWTNDTVTIVWFFSQESSPPGAADEVRYGEGQPVKTTVVLGSLSAWIEDWEAQLDSFPRRGAPPPVSRSQ
jgi:hypothetical protein